MTDSQQRAADKYSELTAILSIGGTRTAYILTHNRDQSDPGQIRNMQHYMAWGMERLTAFVLTYFESGGVNAIVPTFSWHQLFERGAKYAALAMENQKLLIDAERITFYQTNNIDPYFGGIDVLLSMPSGSPEHEAGQMFTDFISDWVYQQGRRKLVWEIAPMPLMTFSNITLPEECNCDLREKNRNLYKFYSRAVYGVEIPVPHFYLGNSRNNDLKLRSHAFALDIAQQTRLYFTQYPAFMADQSRWRADFRQIFENLADDTRLRSTDTDYEGKITVGNVSQLYDQYQNTIKLNGILGL